MVMALLRQGHPDPESKVIHIPMSQHLREWVLHTWLCHKNFDCGRHMTKAFDTSSL